MLCVEKKFRLTGTTPLLGSISMSKTTFDEYIRSKTKSDEEDARAAEDVENVIDSEDGPKATGFYRDIKDGSIILKEYQIRGFLKEAAKALKDQIGVANHVSKIDNLVFVMERNIHLMRDGKRIMNPDGMLERPLRAMTMQGPRVAKAYSEMVENPWYIDITVKVLDNKGSAKSKPMTMEVIEELLKYGELKGLLQWRNGGYGSFTFEELK